MSAVSRGLKGAHTMDDSTDLQVSYRDLRESLLLILGVTTDPLLEIITSLDDAVSNNFGD
jgi:hypothetical protein